MSVRGAPQAEQLRRHASLEEYRAFLSRRNTTGTVSEFSKRYLRFVRLYSDLEMWFAAPRAFARWASLRREQRTDFLPDFQSGAPVPLLFSGARIRLVRLGVAREFARFVHLGLS